MKHPLLAPVALTALLLTACPPSEEKAAPKVSGEAPPTSTSAAGAGAAGLAAVDGKQVYMQFCVNCHGPDGSGAMMRQMLPKIGDLSSPETHSRLKDEEIAALVRSGRDKMPPFGALMKPEQIDAVVTYVRTLKKG